MEGNRLKRKISVIDDDENLAGIYKKKLKEIESVEKLFDVETLPKGDFLKEMQILTKRQETTRAKGSWGDEKAEGIDTTDILIVDYDLVKVSEQGLFLTGESVAYLVRCFSECALIIGLNQFGDDIFDLTLRGHVESFADLNISSRQIANKGLWGVRTDEDGFRPWHWPMLPQFLDEFIKKSGILERQLTKDSDSLISESLGLAKLTETLPRSITGFLGGDSLKISLKQFVERSGNCLKMRDNKSNDEMNSRIAAARLSKWLERLILPRQDILIDAPHLVSRYASLLKGNTTSRDSWNQTAEFCDYKKLGIDYKAIESCRYKDSVWVSRPVWLWNDLSSLETIQEIAEPWKTKATEWVFCEDASLFYHENKCEEFIADLESPYIRRYVKEFKDVNYVPGVRLVQ